MSVELLLAFLWGGLIASAGLHVARTTGRTLVRYGASDQVRAVVHFLFVWGAVAGLILLDYWTKGGFQ